jgi:hypothetical protein
MKNPQKYIYNPHNDISVNDRSPVWWQSQKIREFCDIGSVWCCVYTLYDPKIWPKDAFLKAHLWKDHA